MNTQEMVNKGAFETRETAVTGARTGFNFDLIKWLLQIDSKSAVRKNGKWSARLGWFGHLQAIRKLIGYNGQQQALFAAAVARWQSKNNLVVDGILGPKTWARMRSKTTGSRPLAKGTVLPKGTYWNPYKRANTGDFDPQIGHFTANWVWPVEKEPRAPWRDPVISDGYHYRPSKNRWHNGVDIMFKRSFALPAHKRTRNHQTKWFDMWKGVKALAVGPGRVTHAGQIGTGGRVRINHGQHILSAYMHLDQIFVNPGNQVKTGQVIGLVGGGRGLYHIHFELWKGTNHHVLDPEPYLKRWRIRDI